MRYFSLIKQICLHYIIICSSPGDYNDFLEDLEEDPELRKNINLYKREQKPQWMAEAEEVLAPKVGLEELLDDLVLDVADTDENGNMLTDDAENAGS